jgi:hypothetical protein
MMRHRSPQHWIDTFKNYFWPVLKTHALFRADEQQSLTAELLTLIATFNLATDGTMVVPAGLPREVMSALPLRADLCGAKADVR